MIKKFGSTKARWHGGTRPTRPTITRDPRNNPHLKSHFSEVNLKDIMQMLKLYYNSIVSKTAIILLLEVYCFHCFQNSVFHVMDV